MIRQVKSDMESQCPMYYFQGIKTISQLIEVVNNQIECNKYSQLIIHYKSLRPGNISHLFL